MKGSRTILLAADESNAAQLNGTIYRKQIMRFGKYVNPLYPFFSEDPFMTLDKSVAQEMITNFSKKIVDHVPVPVNHTDDTAANSGEVIKLELSKDGSGLDAYLDIRRTSVAEDLDNGLIFDVSMSFDWDYVDTVEGEHHGIVLLHVALVNNPYLANMTSFEKVTETIKELSRNLIPTALAKGKASSVIMLSESKAKELPHMETAVVKNDKDYAVTIKVKVDDDEVEKTLQPGEETEVPKDQAEDVLTQITDATDPAGDGGGDGNGDDDGAGDGDGNGDGEGDDDDDEDDEEDEGKKGEGQNNLSTTERKELLELRKKQALSDTRSMYQTLLSAGKILPAQEKLFMKLSKVHGQTVKLSKDKTVSLSQLVYEILDAAPQRMKFSEDGNNGAGDGNGAGKDDKDKKPSETLSDAERKGMQATGATPERMDELASKYPAMRDNLKQESNKE